MDNYSNIIASVNTFKFLNYYFMEGKTYFMLDY